MKADLHLHTYYSDGTESPAEVITRANKLGFDVVAITDHDTMEGVQEGILAGQSCGVQVIPGVEITVQFHRQELHLLAYFNPAHGDDVKWNHPDFVHQLKKDALNRTERVRQMVDRLNKLGVPLTVEEVYKQVLTTPSGTSHKNSPITRGALGRPHIALALIAAGHVSSLDEAFSRYLKKGCPAWVDRERADVKAMIALIHRVGGIAVLAHPGFLHDEKILNHLRDREIDGIEVYHSRHSKAQSAKLRNWAHNNQLLITGGSDCHGMLKGEPLMGRVQLKGEELELFMEKLSRL